MAIFTHRVVQVIPNRLRESLRLTNWRTRSLCRMSLLSNSNLPATRECFKCHKWSRFLNRSAAHFDRLMCDDCINRSLRYAAPRIGPAPARSPGRVRPLVAIVG